MERYFPDEKIILVGNPVREDIKNVSNNRIEALNFYQLDENRPVILVIGGSLGARTINQSLLQKLELFAEKGVQLIWQTGKFYFQDIKRQLTGTDQSDIRLCEFIEEMSLAYAAADVVISRAGAFSLAELCLVQKPAILVPSPNVAEDHQTKNAMALVSADAALLVRDEQAVDQLVSKAISLVRDTEKKLELTRNIGKMAKPNAAEDIATEILKLAS